MRDSDDNYLVMEKGADFYLRLRVLSESEQISGKLVWKVFDSPEFEQVPATRIARNVFEVTIPASKLTNDFEYFIEVKAGDETVSYPATYGNINRTVVLLDE